MSVEGLTNLAQYSENALDCWERVEKERQWPVVSRPGDEKCRGQMRRVAVFVVAC